MLDILDQTFFSNSDLTVTGGVASSGIFSSLFGIEGSNTNFRLFYGTINYSSLGNPSSIVKTSGAFLPSLSCPQAGSYTNTWLVTDACGNTSQMFSQTINIIDTVAPLMTNAATGLTVQCGPTNTSDFTNWLISNAGFTATDDCGLVDFTNDFTSLSDDCGATGSATVIFTATDECGNATTSSATFTIIDTLAPVISIFADITEVECDGSGNLMQLQTWLDAHGNAVATDNCSAVTWSYVSTGIDSLCGNTQDLFYKFYATDACGNVDSTYGTFIIHDFTAPVMMVSNDTFECAGATANAAAFAAWLASNAGGSASDACGGALSWTNNSTGLSNGCGETGMETVVFTVSDGCGNSSSATATFVIIDTVAPVITTVAGSLDDNLQCSDAAGIAAALAMEPSANNDECSGASTMNLDSDDLTPDLSCANAYVRVRTWSFTDACGNSSTFVQTINVIDNVAPVITPMSATALDVTLECSDASGLAAALAMAPTATDNCTMTMTPTTTDNTTSGSCAGSYTQVRTWTFSDGCGNSSSYTQTITVQDNTAPTFTKPADITINTNSSCNYFATTFFTGDVMDENDNCGAGSATYTDSIVDGSCTGSKVIYRKWSLSDLCGNMAANQVQVITVQDIMPPTAPTLTAVTLAQCNATPTAPTTTDNCTVGAITGTTSTTFPLAVGSHNTVTWTFTDACGNTSTSTQLVTILDDITIVPVANPIACAGGFGNISWTATGGQSGYTYTFNGAPATSPVDSLVAGSYTIGATDANGCTTEVVVVIAPAPPPLEMTLTATPILCHGGMSTISFHPTGGTPGYIYGSAHDYAYDTINVPASASAYTVYVQDFNGCDATATIMISQPTAVTISATASHVLCNGGSTGSVSLSTGGGTGVITTSPSTTGLSAGPHVFTATDENMCTATTSVTITEPTALSLTLTNSTIVCNGGLSTITFHPAGGTSPYVYGSAGDYLYDTIDVLASPPTHTVYVIDANGCEANTTIIITEPPVLTVDFVTTPDTVVYPFDDMTLVTSSTGGAISYAWGHTSTPSLSFPLNSNMASFTNIDVQHGGEYTITATNATGCTATSTLNVIVQLGVNLNAKVILSGAYDISTNLMRDNLRNLNLIPLSEPYSSAPYSTDFIHVGGGGESMNGSLLGVTGNDAILDWVFIELRSAAAPATVVATRSALVQRDGDVVEIDGSTPIFFDNIYPGSYYVSIKHRNHLGVMTSSAIPMSFPSAASIDFSAVATPLYVRAAPNNNGGLLTGPTRTIAGKRALYGGNCELSLLGNNQFINYNNTATSDRTALFNFAGATGTIPGYTIFDCNFDGLARFNNLNPDRTTIFINTANSNVITTHEQTPN